MSLEYAYNKREILFVALSCAIKLVRSLATHVQCVIFLDELTIISDSINLIIYLRIDSQI